MDKFIRTKSVLMVGIAVVGALLLLGCAKVRAEGRPTAERVFTTEANYVCFLVRDETGKAVGGNCLAE